MKIKNRIEKIENHLKSDNPLDDARALIRVYISTGTIPANIDIEREAKRLAINGIGLKRLMDKIAAEGPPPPQGALPG